MGLARIVMGYVTRYAGGFILVGTAYRAVQDNMLVQEAIGGAIIDISVYFMGHFMADRDMKEFDIRTNRERYKVEKERLEVMNKMESHLEKLANGNVRTYIPDGE